jgi:pimeloyl-ACP methyl ester carboxylesterase
MPQAPRKSNERDSYPLLFPRWFKANPNYLNYFPIPRESVSPEIAQRQTEAIVKWIGTCSVLSKITQPTLVIIGTEDVLAPVPNSLMLVEHIPEAWLVHIRNALMYLYPDKFNKVIQLFLTTQHPLAKIRGSPVR